MVYTVGEMAKKLDVPASTLRYYDKEGLLPFVERSSGGIRMFQESDFEWLQVIGCMKKAGMSIRDIRQYIELALRGDDTIDTVHEYIRQQVTECRSEKVDPTTGVMDYLNKIPRFVSKAAIRILMWLDKHGWVPKDIIATDPYYNSVVISNLGSIKLKCGYHHLTNWGTCSVFCIIGEKKMSPFYDADGSVTMRETLDLGLTIDERLADGYYYSKSIRLLKYLLEHPEELEKPLKEEVSYE